MIKGNSLRKAGVRIQGREAGEQGEETQRLRAHPRASPWRRKQMRLHQSPALPSVYLSPESGSVSTSQNSPRNPLRGPRSCRVRSGAYLVVPGYRGGGPGSPEVLLLFRA